jgi:GNAT superfamily N-acetyltransferase
MTVRIFPVETDAELEAWRRVRMAVVPNERAASVEEMRRTRAPDHLMVLAELDGELAGAGIAGKSDLADSGFVAPRVLEPARRRGVGTALLEALVEHVLALGFTQAGANVDDPGSLAFAERFGFREVNRQIEQVRVVLDEEPEAQLPAGVEIVRVADRPELWTAAYDTVAAQAFLDMALDRPVVATFEEWHNEWLTHPEAAFVAFTRGEVIGCAGLQPDADFPERAEHALTAVRRDWRRRGVATALKRTTLAWASANAIREVYTWTQSGNDDMRRVNERLGYITRTESISVRASLPLPL